MSSITIIGGGLAGCEAAWAAASRGVQVRLVEMKPVRFSPAHKSPLLAELVCSNSLKAKRLESAAGLLKAEMRQMGSLLLQAADLAEVDAGGALAVDRDIFSGWSPKRSEATPISNWSARKPSPFPRVLSYWPPDPFARVRWPRRFAN